MKKFKICLVAFLVILICAIIFPLPVPHNWELTGYEIDENLNTLNPVKISVEGYKLIYLFRGENKLDVEIYIDDEFAYEANGPFYIVGDGYFVSFTYYNADKNVMSGGRLYFSENLDSAVLDIYEESKFVVSSNVDFNIKDILDMFAIY